MTLYERQGGGEASIPAPAGRQRVYLARWTCLDVESNLRRIGDEAGRAAAAGAELCLFPELFLTGYRRTVLPVRARRRFAEVSSAHPEIIFVFGSLSEERRNRMTVWRDGREFARYDKIHLFAPNREADFWEPGDRYVAAGLSGWSLGLINCNDIRFPEQARALRLQAGCRMLAAVAWWPFRRDHVWETLLRARAMENGAFVLGCCVAASEWPDEPFAGAGNHVFDPRGEPVRTLDDRTYELDFASLSDLLVDPEEGWRDIAAVETHTLP